MIRIAVFSVLAALVFIQGSSQSVNVVAAEPEVDTENLTPPPPPWLKTYRFQQSKFSFVRIQYGDERGIRRSRWMTDFPDADLGFASQLGRITSLDVTEPSRVLRLTDAAIAEHPIVYLCEPGGVKFSDDERTALRRYLDDGGFLFGDDFWGEDEWRSVQAEMRKVLPECEPVDLPLMHPLFHCVFELSEKPLVPNIHYYTSGETTERTDATEAHYWAYFDKAKRMVALFCQNTDLGDGWERTGVDADYTREMSIARAYPMGINIVFFALTQGIAKR